MLANPRRILFEYLLIYAFIKWKKSLNGQQNISKPNNDNQEKTARHTRTVRHLRKIELSKWPLLVQIFFLPGHPFIKKVRCVILVCIY